MKLSEKEFGHYLDKFSHFGENFAVIKVSGSLATDKDFIFAIQFLAKNNIFPIIVHGAGKATDSLMLEKGIKLVKKNGLRQTCVYTLECVEYAVSKINKDIVNELNKNNIISEGIAFPKTNNLEIIHELGFVAKAKNIKTDEIKRIISENKIPIIGCTIDFSGDKFNANADNVASVIAKVMSAKKLIFISDVPGVLDLENKLISVIKKGEIPELVQTKKIIGGMAVKLLEIEEILKQSSKMEIQIVSPKNLLQELFSYNGSGTIIKS